MNAKQWFHRREIVRQFALGMVGWWTAGGWMESQVLAVDTGNVPETATVTLSLDAFPVLAADGGSIRLEMGGDQPIIVSRLNDVFYAVGSRCTHNGCTVNAYNAAAGRISCPCHGSQYFIDGTVRQGPAPLPLARYEASFNGTEVKVRVPGVTFGARRLQIVSTNGASKRVSLSFHARVFTNYQVHYRDSLTNSPMAIPFSLTAEGTASQMIYRNTVYNPNDPTPLVDLYVDVSGPRGFFSIVMLPFES